ncbi:MAG: RNA polymerase sigma-70 factor (ECF subfamily) [Lentisphaeria bacterium]|jgi:RNA polymerase sigma-70 factor (ECF subfamily)
MDETELIRTAQSGDSVAFERLLNLRYDTVYRFAMGWCGCHADAEDIAQLACIKLARGLHQFKFDAAFTTWLYRLVINCAKDWQRSQGRHAQTEQANDMADRDGTHPEATAADNPEAQVYLRQILSWAERLGEGFKETLVLVCGEGLSHAEAAHILDVKESTVSWRIHNVRQKLNLLDNEEGDAL